MKALLRTSMRVARIALPAVSLFYLTRQYKSQILFQQEAPRKVFEKHLLKETKGIRVIYFEFDDSDFDKELKQIEESTEEPVSVFYVQPHETNIERVNAALKEIGKDLSQVYSTVSLEEIKKKPVLVINSYNDTIQLPKSAIDAFSKGFNYFKTYNHLPTTFPYETADNEYILLFVPPEEETDNFNNFRKSFYFLNKMNVKVLATDLESLEKLGIRGGKDNYYLLRRETPLNKQDEGFKSTTIENFKVRELPEMAKIGSKGPFEDRLERIIRVLYSKGSMISLMDSHLEPFNFVQALEYQNATETFLTLSADMAVEENIELLKKIKETVSTMEEDKQPFIYVQNMPSSREVNLFKSYAGNKVDLKETLLKDTQINIDKHHSTTLQLRNMLKDKEINKESIKKLVFSDKCSLEQADFYSQPVDPSFTTLSSENMEYVFREHDKGIILVKDWDQRVNDKIEKQLELVKQREGDTIFTMRRREANIKALEEQKNLRLSGKFPVLVLFDGNKVKLIEGDTFISPRATYDTVNNLLKI